MPSNSRGELILEHLREKSRFMTVEQLRRDLYVSAATIRRDLSALAQSGLIRRTRGGALLVEGITSEDPMPFRENKNAAQKQIIADMALKHVRDGMTLFLDSSTTALTFARGLSRFSNLRVVTNGLKTALLLSDCKHVSVMCTGGFVRENSKALVGQATVEYIARLSADAAFLSCRGFSLENGASEASEEEYYVKRQFLQNSRRAYLLCDTSKMNADYLCRTAPLSQFDEIITERKDVNDLCNKPQTASGIGE